MTIADVIPRLSSFPSEAVIFAQKSGGHFQAGAEAAVLELDDAELLEQTSEIAGGRTNGLSYFLEVFIAREVAEAWETMRAEWRDSALTTVDAVIFYAENDAWPIAEVG